MKHGFLKSIHRDARGAFGLARGVVAPWAADGMCGHGARTVIDGAGVFGRESF